MQSEEYDLAWNALIKKDLEKIHKFLNENISKEFADETLRNIFHQLNLCALHLSDFQENSNFCIEKKYFAT